MNPSERIQYALNVFPKLKEHFMDFTCNPEHKLSNFDGVDVLPSDPEGLRFKALGFEFIIQFNIVFMEKYVALGQITAYSITEYKEQLLSKEPILSIWTDEFGNLKKQEPTTSAMSSVRGGQSLPSFVCQVLEIIVDSKVCEPST
jgi:hypothetical protein